jgi:hypothetical protein
MGHLIQPSPKSAISCAEVAEKRKPHRGNLTGPISLGVADDTKIPAVTSVRLGWSPSTPSGIAVLSKHLFFSFLYCHVLPREVLPPRPRGQRGSVSTRTFIAICHVPSRSCVRCSATKTLPTDETSPQRRLVLNLLHECVCGPRVVRFLMVR